MANKIKYVIHFSRISKSISRFRYDDFISNSFLFVFVSFSMCNYSINCNLLQVFQFLLLFIVFFLFTLKQKIFYSLTLSLLLKYLAINKNEEKPRNCYYYFRMI